MHETYKNPQNPIEQLADANDSVAREVANHGDELDNMSADFILRNMAVIADRMNPKTLSGLSRETLDQVDVILFISKDIAPIDPADTVRHDHESDDEYIYRKSVILPLHSLQSKVHIRDFDKDNELEVSKIRYAVEAAGLAFSSVLRETAHSNPAIRETVGYFRGNTEAAQRRMDLLATRKS